jgi:DNA-binding HxlR family transcriptional regulator
MAFYQIAGNEENLARWEKKLCEEWRLVTKSQEGDRVFYSKTELGESLHKILRNHEYVGTLFEELIRDRLRPGNW